MNFSFLPAEVKFYDYFEKASQNLVEGARLLKNLSENLRISRSRSHRSPSSSIKGDFIVHDVTNLLARSLITPFDGDDIQRLIRRHRRRPGYHARGRRSASRSTRSPRSRSRPTPGAPDRREAPASSTQPSRACTTRVIYDQVKERIVQINTIENTGDRVLEEGLRSLVEHRDDIFRFHALERDLRAAGAKHRPAGGCGRRHPEGDDRQCLTPR